MGNEKRPLVFVSVVRGSLPSDVCRVTRAPATTKPFVLNTCPVIVPGARVWGAAPAPGIVSAKASKARPARGPRDRAYFLMAVLAGVWTSPRLASTGLWYSFVAGPIHRAAGRRCWRPLAEVKQMLAGDDIWRVGTMRLGFVHSTLVRLPTTPESNCVESKTFIFPGVPPTPEKRDRKLTHYGAGCTVDPELTKGSPL